MRRFVDWLGSDVMGATLVVAIVLTLGALGFSIITRPTTVQAQTLERVPSPESDVPRWVDPQSRISCYYHVESKQFACASWGAR